MATLQSIRSKGPLLLIVVGLALFAFIAGDVFKVIQPHQTQDVGEINGDAVSAQEYQDLVEEYTEVIRLTQNNNAISDEISNQIKDVVWRNYVNNKLIEAEAEKIGLTVSDAEIQAIIDAGVHPLLRQTPFINQQTGAFDKDMLKKFFPHAFKATELTAFIISLIIYVVIDIVCGVVIGLLAAIPIIGIIFSLLGSLIGLYALVGIVLSILVFVKVLK